MAAFNQEIVYYNTFLLKNTTTKAMVNSSTYTGSYPVTKQEFHAVYPGVPYKGWSGTNTKLVEYDGSINFTNSGSVVKPKSNVNHVSTVFNDTLGSNWIIEESRIRGGYNNAPVELGVRAFLREDSNEALERPNALVYSGIFNSRTGFNETNVFPSLAIVEVTKIVFPFSFIFGNKKVTFVLSILNASDNTDLGLFCATNFSFSEAKGILAKCGRLYFSRSF